MLSLALIAILLPSYPNNALPNVPEQVRLAQHYESINPYICIQYANQYLEAPSSLGEKVELSTSQRLYALNTLASCQITAEEITSAQKTLEQISQIPVTNNSINEQILILAEHNRERIHMYEMTQNNMRQRDSSHSATPEFRGPLQIEDLKTYSYLMNAINSIHARNFIEAGSTLDYLHKSNKINKNSDRNLWEMLYLTTSYLYQEANVKDRSFNYLGKLYTLYKQNNQDFYAAITAREMATILADAGFYEHAIYMQQSYLKIIERIPEYQTQYIRGIAELTSYEFQAGNTSNSYSMLLKSELLLENTDIGINDKAFINEQLGYAFKMQGDRARAVKYLETAAEIFKNEKSVENYYNTIIDLTEIYLTTGKYENAQKLLAELLNVTTQLSLEKQVKIQYLRARLYAARKNLPQAYTILRSMFEQDPNNTQFPVLSDNFKNIVNNALPELVAVAKNKESSPKGNSYIDESLSTDLPNRTNYVLLLITLVLMLLFSVSHRRNVKYRQELSSYEDNKAFYKNMVLPGENELISYLFSLNYNNKLEHRKTEHSLPQEKEILNIYIPCFTRMAMEKGNDKTKQIERIFTDKLFQLFEDQIPRIYRISKDRIILIKNKNTDMDAQSTCNNLLENIQQFLRELHLPDEMSIGGIEYPFLLNSTIELTENKIIELCLLALHASCYITSVTKKSSWVLLPSINIEKKITLSGDIREIAVEAFERGILHYYVSHGREQLNWRQLLQVTSDLK